MIRVIGLNIIVNNKGGQVDLCLLHQKIFNLFYVVEEQMTSKSHSYLIVCCMKRTSNDSLIPKQLKNSREGRCVTRMF